MSLKKQAGYGRWPPKKQDMGDEKNMWDMGEENFRDRKRLKFMSNDFDQAKC